MNGKAGDSEALGSGRVDSDFLGLDLYCKMDAPACIWNGTKFSNFNGRF